MRPMTKKYVIAILMLSFSSCVRFWSWESFDYFHRYDKCTPNPTKMVGVWKAKDGATIELNRDGTCSLHNVQCIVEYTACRIEKDTSSVWNFNGYWSIKPELSGAKDTLGFRVHLGNRLPKDAWSKGDCEVRLRIHNKKVSGEVVPAMLYDFIGDPDNFETYDFCKQEKQ